jgi:AcrR family transcriptional regulator
VGGLSRYDESAEAEHGHPCAPVRLPLLTAVRALRPPELAGPEVPDLSPQPESTAPAPPDETVIRAAARYFMTTGTLEMRALAKRLGVGRATLYRWRGSRTQLLSDLLLWLGLRNLQRSEVDVATPAGPRRLLDVHAIHIARMTTSPALRSFVRNEPELASSLLLDAHGKVHVGVTSALADLIHRQEIDTGWVAPFGAEKLAQIISRIDEAFMYADLIAKDEPNPDIPGVLFEMLVGMHRGDVTTS